MTTSRVILLVLYLLRQAEPSQAISGRGNSQVLLGEVDIAVRDDGSASEITTEEPYLKKCIVDGNAYSHSQTIPSYDVNSHCLCVAGEVYCWWQNYNPSTDSSIGSASSLSTTLGSNYTPMLEVSTDTADSSEASGDYLIEETLVGQSQGRVEINSTYSTTPSAPTTCLVMGREYREGEVLPHSTGNCVECSCGSEGRVECSPRDCVPLRPELPVAPDIPEPPGADFEVFDLARDRGIDEGF
ncbi:hypothetical protein HZH66_011605 [Vespula vulgaris]|uniref:Kielin/chordin-like protein n=1 Tax=Vespula vulgaris TaxID=7454 RepID=A0A834JCP8_VESVU|nr:uncharacterized protein LOC127068877 [Vespula vulgaris]KAF7385763.1 hypothetical protein HZH66_011605 [Vespula vulgaris]